MSCKGQLEPPTPKLPDGIKVPFGDSIDKIKNFATGGGIGAALKNVGGMIDGVISGAIGNITSAVGDAINNITSLKNKIQNFDPTAAFKSFGGVDDIKDKIKGQIPGKDEMMLLENAQIGADCAREQIGALAAQQAKIIAAAQAKAKNVSAKQRLQAIKNPEQREQMSAQIAADVEEDLAADVAAEAEKPAEDRSVDDLLSDESLNSLDGGVLVSTPEFIDSLITSAKVGWPLENLQNGTGDFDVTPALINDLLRADLEQFSNGIGSNLKQDTEWSYSMAQDTHAHMVYDNKYDDVQTVHVNYIYRSPARSVETSGLGSTVLWEETLGKKSNPVDPSNMLYSLYIRSHTYTTNDKRYVALLIDVSYTHTYSGDVRPWSTQFHREFQEISDAETKLTKSLVKQGVDSIIDKLSKIDRLTGESILSNMIAKY